MEVGIDGGSLTNAFRLDFSQRSGGSSKGGKKGGSLQRRRGRDPAGDADGGARGCERSSVLVDSKKKTGGGLKFQVKDTKITKKCTAWTSENGGTHSTEAEKRAEGNEGVLENFTKGRAGSLAHVFINFHATT